MMMNIIKLPAFRLAGIRLPHKTSNEGGQSNVDCGTLWQKFTSDNIIERIPAKVADDVYAVYFDYEGDHTKPFRYFIGCKVKEDADIPKDLDSLLIPAGNYSVALAKGKIPDCIAGAWKEIWRTADNRAYTYDFEVYNEKSKDWSNAEVEICLSSII